MSAADPLEPIPLFAFPLFATSIGGHEQHNQALLEEILAQQNSSEGVLRSNRGGAWHSDPSFMTLRTPALGWLLHHVMAYGRASLGRLYGDWARSELRLGSYWANVLPTGAWNAPHHHHPQHWSGVYYVAVPPAPASAAQPQGMIEFLNPAPVQSQWGGGSFAYQPREGSLLLFPASLVHLVHPHQADADRVSIALNLDVVARTG